MWGVFISLVVATLDGQMYAFKVSLQIYAGLLAQLVLNMMITLWLHPHLKDMQLLQQPKDRSMHIARTLCMTPVVPPQTQTPERMRQRFHQLNA